MSDEEPTRSQEPKRWLEERLQQAVEEAGEAVCNYVLWGLTHELVRKAIENVFILMEYYNLYQCFPFLLKITIMPIIYKSFLLHLQQYYRDLVGDITESTCRGREIILQILNEIGKNPPVIDRSPKKETYTALRIQLTGPLICYDRASEVGRPMQVCELPEGTTIISIGPPGQKPLQNLPENRENRKRIHRITRLFGTPRGYYRVPKSPLLAIVFKPPPGKSEFDDVDGIYPGNIVYCFVADILDQLPPGMIPPFIEHLIATFREDFPKYFPNIYFMLHYDEILEVARNARNRRAIRAIERKRKRLLEKGREFFRYL